jgi:tripartite-type tricarboxylate transporter receptor subunit TctC
MLRRKLKKALLAALGILLAAVATPAIAAWPEQPIRIVVPYPAGGAVDAMLRVMTPKMSEKLGQPIVVDNRAGANANLGPALVSKAKPDGYTLLASATYLLVNPLIDTELGWRPSDFEPVAKLSMTHNLFFVGSSSPWNNLADFVAAARARPGLPIGSGGVGSPQSMAHELLRVRAGLDFNVIPYRGSPPMMMDLLNGTVVMGVLPLAAAKGMLEGGKLRALATASEERSKLTPTVPTTAEAGYADMIVLSWYGLHAPAGTPAAVVQAIAEAARAAALDPEVQATAATAGGEIGFLGTTDFIQFLNRDRDRWERTVATLKKQ